MMSPSATDAAATPAKRIEFEDPHAGIGNLLITSTHKMICYFMLENVETGTITGADHLAWFYGEEF